MLTSEVTHKVTTIIPSIKGSLLPQSQGFEQDVLHGKEKKTPHIQIHQELTYHNVL
jgi:hypothetical protein